ncbi:hypothetical protein F5Y08DRAFT_352390 [Xylaria arbuscula]|nr:hypothetical protein F5Y08DRAFT_352390 [Xylaria arbuscula]
MCDIYAAAQRVVIWLGLEADDSAYALNELTKLGNQLDVTYKTEKITILSPVDGEIPPRDETTLELRFGKRELEAVAALIDRKWFGRLWIRQEIYVASAARHMTYKYLRRELAGVHWTDPRDAVYAVQGMLRSEDRAVGVVPDYSLSPASVYTDVAVRVMQAQESLDVTSSCDMAQHDMENLPSWVPDWWKHTNMKMEGTMEPYCRYSRDDRRERQSYGAEFNPDFLQSLRSLPLQDALEPGAAYVDNTSLLEGYCRLFCCERFDEDTNLYREWVATRDECSAALREILSDDMADPLQDKSSPGFKLMRMAHAYLRGRCFFRTTHGHCGSASEATQPGDLVCVFVGSSRPSVLRAVNDGDSVSRGPRWRLVSDSYVPGLMAGEAVHGRLPAYYKPTQCRPPGDSHKWRSSIWDIRTGDLL